MRDLAHADRVAILDYLWLEVEVVGEAQGVDLLRNSASTSIPTRERLRIQVEPVTSGWIVQLDRRRHRARDLHHVAETAYAAVHDRVSAWARSEGWLRLHAALVDIEGHRIVVAGPSGVGKTTTAVALTGPASTVLGDEAVLIRDGLAIALPRPLHAKHGGSGITGLTEAMVLARLDYDDPIAVLDPAAVNGVAIVRHAPEPIELIVLLDPHAEPSSVRPVDTGEAIIALAPDAGPFTSDRGALVRAVIGLAESTRMVRVGRGTPEQTAATIRGLI